MEKFYYDIPTQVIFTEDVDGVISKSAGIAYKDEIICMCCGAIIDNDYVLDIVELPWVDVAEEVGGEGFRKD